eukprot:TRINITY_DN2855_c1_g4_i1.p1 TRINITY_DN2855_c1_g4~~TRINITY_DN2855_c1_g4_i1.p1  ORF type:complete len:142 (+),score=36.98 TRINITY_DN2855_c1_g4_i1:43-468(+)
MGALKNFNCDVVQQTKTVEGDKKELIIQCGLSYSGICTGKECAAGKKSVLCNKGYVTDLIVNEDCATCPLCGTPFEIQQICLYRCDAKVTLLDHVEESALYRPRKADVVKIGAKNSLKFNPNDLTLMTITAKRVNGGCHVM